MSDETELVETPPDKPPKVLQIATANRSNGTLVLYALRDDGTVWLQEAGPQGQHSAPWQQIQGPQD